MNFLTKFIKDYIFRNQKVSQDKATYNTILTKSYLRNSFAGHFQSTRFTTYTLSIFDRKQMNITIVLLFE